ncbi:MAG: SpoIIE family protein phosphatase [Opitutales bacterium]
MKSDFPTHAPYAGKAEASRVLLIEDNPGDALLMQEWVSEAAGDRFTVEWVDLLSTALGRLSGGEVFDLILLDLSLPDSRGWDTFVRVHEAMPDFPIVVLSGLDDEALAVKTVQEGAQDYLVKSHIDANSLVRAMRYALERRDSERALAEERNLLRSLLDNLPDPIYVKDREGRYLIDNRAHMDLLGVQFPHQIISKTVFDFFPEELAKKYDEDDQYILNSGKPIVNRVERHLTRDGVQLWVSTTKVPLRNVDGEIFGIVGIGRDITERKRAEEQLARYNAELREKNEQLEADLRMAREIQQAFLPQKYPRFPHTANRKENALHFCHRYRPTEQVGGDFYHVLALSDTQAGVFICDVMGHGVRSALVTAILRALVEELVPVAGDPGRFLHEINQALITILKRTRTLMFATAFYLIADVKKNQVRFANAGGHPSPLHIRRDVNTVEPLGGNGGTPGPALGLLGESVYSTAVSDLALHDLFFFFTDGLYEVEGSDDEFYNQEKLFAAVRQRIMLPPQKLFDELLSEIQAFSIRKEFVDDVCLVGMEVAKTGVGGPDEK